jgi:hypothetical protein
MGGDAQPFPRHFGHRRIAQGAAARSPPATPAIPAGPQPRSIGATIAGFKSAAPNASTRCVEHRECLCGQRTYHERALRSDDSLNDIREYILANPSRWTTDRENPSMHSI